MGKFWKKNIRVISQKERLQKIQSVYKKLTTNTSNIFRKEMSRHLGTDKREINYMLGSEDFNVIRPLLSFWSGFSDLSTCLGFSTSQEILIYWVFMVCCCFVLSTEDTLEKSVYSYPWELKFRIEGQLLLGFSNIIHLLPLVILIFPFLYNVPEDNLVQN